MTNVLDRWPVDKAFLAMLRAGTARPVGDNRMLGDSVPVTDPHWADHVPADGKGWAIMYCLPGGRTYGPPYGDPDADSDFIYQVSSVGKSREQAQWMADLVRRCVIKMDGTGGYAVTMTATAGWAVKGRLLEGALGGIETAGKEPNLTFTVAERFRVLITPS